jgi:hypothetical protein
MIVTHVKILFFMTGYRQNEEYRLQSRLLRKCPRLAKCAELFIYNNCIDNKIEDACKDIPIPFRIHNTDKNAGYRLGPVEAMDFLVTSMDLSGYDYVIHLHPDVFIVDEEPLMRLLDEESATPNVFLVNTAVPEDPRFYCFDFFIFKPRLLVVPLFANWTVWKEPPEYFLHDRIVENGVAHRMVNRYNNQVRNNTREIDLLGLWHEHELSRVLKYLS